MIFQKTCSLPPLSPSLPPSLRYLDRHAVRVVEGAIAETSALLAHQWKLNLSPLSPSLPPSLSSYLDQRAVRVVEGAIAETSALLAQRWDLVFFTGSETVGKIVHQACAKHLTPCILELGGKSPVLVDKSVRDVQLAARRVVWGKFVNVGT